MAETGLQTPLLGQLLFIQTHRN